LLEAEAARLAATHATAAEIEHLRELCRQGLAALKADKLAAVVTANADLHAAIAQFCGNPVLVDLAAQVGCRVRWYYTPIARQRGELSWREHTALIDAIEARDGDRPPRSCASTRAHPPRLPGEHRGQREQSGQTRTARGSKDENVAGECGSPAAVSP